MGSASLGMIAASALLSRWFSGRIGAIMAVPYAAIGAGMLLLPPLTQLALTGDGLAHLAIACSAVCCWQSCRWSC